MFASSQLMHMLFQGARVHVSGRLMYGEITDQQGVSVLLLKNQIKNRISVLLVCLCRPYQMITNLFCQAKQKTTTIAADEIIFLGKTNKT